MRARRVDANSDEIAEAAERLGITVHKTNREWDQTWQYGWSTLLVEVKDGSKPPSKQKLTPAEKKTHEKMRIIIVTSMNDVLFEAKALKNAEWSRVKLK